ncbi:MAG: ATP-binding protein [Bdellovibrionales bacterium]
MNQSPDREFKRDSHLWSQVQRLIRTSYEMNSAPDVRTVLQCALPFACELARTDAAQVHLRGDPPVAFSYGRGELHATRFSVEFLAHVGTGRDPAMVTSDVLSHFGFDETWADGGLVFSLHAGDGQLLGVLLLRTGKMPQQTTYGLLEHFTHLIAVCVEKMRWMEAVERRQVEFEDQLQRLRALADEARSATEAKSAFLASITHEIRTPLGVILGFADLALDHPALPEETRNYILSIKQNGQQLSRMLGEVLDLSKIEAARMEVESVRFPLRPMLDEVISSMELTAKERGLELKLEIPTSIPRIVRTDPTRLRQILLNLIGNAFKFTTHGHVAVRTKFQEIPAVGAHGRLEFEVEDTGTGIPPESQEKLFQPFVQLDRSASRRFGGAGLGLCLSKQLVQALGGELYLKESRVGAGSTFAFSIDSGPFEGELVGSGRQAGGKRKVLPGPAIELSNLSGKRILVVEDSEDNQLLIQRYLTAVGVQVELASNGAEGVEKASSQGYDLVVMDIQMPGMDGHQAARILRQSGFSKPIVALTAHAFKEDRDRALASGFDEYLTKPINRLSLLKTLDQQLSGPTLH